MFQSRPTNPPSSLYYSCSSFLSFANFFLVHRKWQASYTAPTSNGPERTLERASELVKCQAARPAWLVIVPGARQAGPHLCNCLSNALTARSLARSGLVCCPQAEANCFWALKLAWLACSSSDWALLIWIGTKAQSELEEGLVRRAEQVLV